MNIDKLFRLSLIAYIFFSVSSVVAGFYSSYLLSLNLQNHINAQAEESILFPRVIIFLLMIPAFLMFIASLVGLFRWKLWGRKIFLFSNIFLYCFLPFIGPFVLSGTDHFFQHIGSALIGLILGLAYFSPVAQRFENHATS